MTNQGIQKVLDQYHAGIPMPEIVTGVMRLEQVKKAGGKRPCGENSIRGSDPEKAGEKE